jgi:hypothetical protein
MQDYIEPKHCKDVKDITTYGDSNHQDSKE